MHSQASPRFPSTISNYLQAFDAGHTSTLKHKMAHVLHCGLPLPAISGLADLAHPDSSKSCKSSFLLYGLKFFDICTNIRRGRAESPSPALQTVHRWRSPTEPSHEPIDSVSSHDSVHCTIYLSKKDVPASDIAPLFNMCELISKPGPGFCT